MQQRSRQRLTQRNRFSWNRAGVTLPSLTAVRSITERPLRGHSAAAKRNRRLAREIPLLPIHIDQRYRALHAKRPIRPNRTLHCRNRPRLCRRNIQYFIRHKSPLSSAHWKTLADKVRIANVERSLRPSSNHIHFHLIDETPAPALTRLNRPHNRMFRRIEMLRSMSVGRRIAASHMTTNQAHPQMHPLAANLQALLATLRRRLHLPNLIQMATFHGNTFPRPDSISPSDTNPHTNEPSRTLPLFFLLILPEGYLSLLFLLSPVL